ncbi:hypothetical protein CR513_28563, partial [Mucuna pruriens]
MNSNPLPAHGGASINDISHECWAEELEEAQQGRTSRREEEEVGIPLDSANWAKSTQVVAIGENDNPPPKPLIIQYNSASQPKVPLIIQVLAKPAYRNNHIVPWKYNEGGVIPPSQEKADLARRVTNIARI